MTEKIGMADELIAALEHCSQLQERMNRMVANNRKREEEFEEIWEANRRLRYDIDKLQTEGKK